MFFFLSFRVAPWLGIPRLCLVHSRGREPLPHRWLRRYPPHRLDRCRHLQERRHFVSIRREPLPRPILNNTYHHPSLSLSFLSFLVQNKNYYIFASSYTRVPDLLTAFTKKGHQKSLEKKQKTFVCPLVLRPSRHKWLLFHLIVSCVFSSCSS